MTQKSELKEVVTKVLRRVIGQFNSQLSHQDIDPCPSSWTEVKIWTFHLLAPSTAFQLIKTVHAMLAAKIIVENFPYYCYNYCTWTLPQLLTKVAEITESHPVRSIYQITVVGSKHLISHKDFTKSAAVMMIGIGCRCWGWWRKWW